MSNDDDEFGDASFLARLDVDQIVDQHYQDQKKRANNAATTNNDDNDEEFGDASFLADVDMMDHRTGVSSNQNEHNRDRNEHDNENEDYKKRLAVSQICQDENWPDRLGESASSKRPRHFYDDNINIKICNAKLFQDTMQEYFGYSSFRSGQLEVIHAVVNERRDAAIFWATGKGKSLCYQIPALIRNPANPRGQVVVVVSPLISLMQDQVHKINGLGNKMVANYLGTGQTDLTVEARALEGEFSLLYVTPEKLVSGNFLRRMEQLHTSIKPIALFAIDEAHCVSEWGHDFRKEFRDIGRALREDATAISNIPILALTATAVPRVQDDIVESLRLRNNPYKALQSFDRPNLEIKVSKKPSGGIAGAFMPLVQTLQKSSRPSLQSTIVYAPSRAAVEEIASFIQRNIDQGSQIVCEAYHAGMSPAARHNVHTNFLTGKTNVICSTVAFGMGIDKPDIRRVVHYGPPKTLEEYYQQIGRAGRDGMPAECLMWVSEADFDRYQGDFYLGNLKGAALQATKNSIAALRAFSLDSEKCRRKTLLEYFQEVPPWGDRCKTCDNCLKQSKYGGDSQRDFGPIGARLVLQAAGDMKSQSVSHLIQVMQGKLVEDFRYVGDKNATKRRLESLMQNVPNYSKQQYLKELLASLVCKGLITESSKSANQGGYKRTWTVYDLSPAGIKMLQNKTAPIMLPVPDSVREFERKQEERLQRVLANLEKNGINTEKLPVEEVQKGDGQVLRAYAKWFTYAEKRDGDRLASLQKLLLAIEEWRSATAFKHWMAPGSVLLDHIMYGIAYAQATLPPGQKLDSLSLIGAGVRSKEIEGLVAALGQWVDECQPAVLSKSADPVMVFPGRLVGGKKWKYAVYKPAKKTGVAVWEVSYIRFTKGESPQTIAMVPEGNRKPVQVATIIGHLLEALIHGKQVDVAQIAKVLPPPTKSEWQRLQEAEAHTGMSVTGDPDTSGLNGDKFLVTDFVRPIVGASIADKPFGERSDEEAKIFSSWCDKLKWYQALRRIDYTPSFGL